jgi:2-dehydro-3-deoxygluconokinase
MRGLMPFCDTVIANEEDADLALGIRATDTDVKSGALSLAGYERVAAQIVADFPNVSNVAVTLRQSISASHNNWGALLYDASQQKAFVAPTDGNGDYAPYEIQHIVDRVGAGDSFAGALIYALNQDELAQPETALRYAVAASCLKHSVQGDVNYASRDEIERLMQGAGSGRIER